MLVSVATLEHYRVHAVDGEIGHVYDVYFDDVQWTVRHVVVTTGHWLSRQRVLVPLASLRRVDATRRELHLALTKAQVAGSPDAETDKPVSREDEVQLYRYYGFPYSWNEPAVRVSSRVAVEQEHSVAPLLRSARAVTGYAVRELDDMVGHVADVLMDDDRWTIRYLVVDTRDWWPGKKVLVAVPWIIGIVWTGVVHVALPRETITDAPEYDPTRPVDRAYEQRLYGYYGRCPYWHDPPGR
jgi:hypothetical protein